MKILVTPGAAKILPLRKRVAAYARVSSGKDAMLHSLSAQISYFSDLIQGHPEWEFRGIFADEAQTGTKEDRPQYKTLLEECRGGYVDMIITKSISRFARNTVTVLATVRELKALGVDIYFEREKIHSMSADGELMMTILSSYAQEESRSASENCKWRIRRDFKEGRPNTGKMLGYHLVGGVLTIIPEEAALVQQIFEWYMDGMGLISIEKRLKAQGIKFCKNGIAGILKNVKYTGDMLLQKTYVRDHISKQKMINHGELPMYFVADSHEYIIKKELFDAVQAEIAKRAAHYNSPVVASPTYPFTSLIKCGHCGASYRRKVIAVGTKYERTAWICATFNTYGKERCPSQQIPEWVLMEKTAETLGLPAFDEKALKESISEIIVPDKNKLIVCLYDGQRREIEWHTTRKDSWTPEMKEAARQRQLDKYRGGNIDE